MIELTIEQRRAISNDDRPTALDPDTNAVYVLIRQEAYERIKGLIYDDSEMTHDDLRRLFARTYQANGWDDPRMDEYDQYEEKRKCS